MDVTLPLLSQWHEDIVITFVIQKYLDGNGECERTKEKQKIGGKNARNCLGSIVLDWFYLF